MPRWFRSLFQPRVGKHREGQVISVGQAYRIKYPALYFEKGYCIPLKEWKKMSNERRHIRARIAELKERANERRLQSNWRWLEQYG